LAITLTQRELPGSGLLVLCIDTVTRYSHVKLTISSSRLCNVLYFTFWKSKKQSPCVRICCCCM